MGLKAGNKHIIMIALAMILVFCTLGYGDDVTPVPKSKDTLNFLLNENIPETPAYDPLALQMDFRSFQWGLMHGDFSRNDHQFTVVGGLYTNTEPYLWGDSFNSGNFMTSATYRYKGLFGGVVRPVARFTAGTGQGMYFTGTGGYSGMVSGMQGYAITEAGVEVVIEGYGIGVTYAKIWRVDPMLFMQDDKYTGGVFTPVLSGPESLKDWFTNIYLIIE